MSVIWQLLLTYAQCLAGNFQDVHAGSGPIDNINKTPIINLDIVCLNSRFAALGTINIKTSFLGIRCRCRNIRSDFPGRIRIADINHTYTGIEV